MSGFWLGSFTNTNTGVTSYNEGELFKSDSSTVQYDFYGSASLDTATCPLKAYGTYTLSGNTVNFSISFASLSQNFNETGTLNTSVNPNTIAGTFTSATIGGGSGTFSFAKQ
jgi:hypothetical protein